MIWGGGENEKKMQLDVEVSPPANRKSLRLTLAHVIFDFDLDKCYPSP